MQNIVWTRERAVTISLLPMFCSHGDDAYAGRRTEPSAVLLMAVVWRTVACPRFYRRRCHTGRRILVPGRRFMPACYYMPSPAAY